MIRALWRSIGMWGVSPRQIHICGHRHTWTAHPPAACSGQPLPTAPPAQGRDLAAGFLRAAADPSPGRLSARQPIAIQNTGTPLHFRPGAPLSSGPPPGKIPPPSLTIQTAAAPISWLCAESTHWPAYRTAASGDFPLVAAFLRLSWHD